MLPRCVVSSAKNCASQITRKGDRESQRPVVVGALLWRLIAAVIGLSCWPVFCRGCWCRLWCWLLSLSAASHLVVHAVVTIHH